MKLCKDCKHCRPDVFAKWMPGFTKYEFSKCDHPSAILVENVVSGESEHTFCELSRRWVDGCGPSGQHYEAKPTPPKRWWEFWK